MIVNLTLNYSHFKNLFIRLPLEFSLFYALFLSDSPKCSKSPELADISVSLVLSNVFERSVTSVCCAVPVFSGSFIVVSDNSAFSGTTGLSSPFCSFLFSLSAASCRFSASPSSKYLSHLAIRASTSASVSVTLKRRRWKSI